MNNTQMKILLVPEDIIRSVKDEKNRTLPGVNFAAISNEEVFNSQSNVTYVTKHMYLKHRYNGGFTPRDVFEKAIPLIMKTWSIKQNLDSFEGWNNYHYILTLDYINDKFIKDHKEYYTVQGSDTNVFKIQVPVGHMNEFDGKVYEKKKYDEMTAQDYQNLDVYGPMQAFTQNSEKNRYKNKIPTWQRSMNIRQYSKDNEGLASKSWSRASLSTPIRGYNMKNIVATTGRENDLSWTDF
jgi:hypothetical protein